MEELHYRAILATIQQEAKEICRKYFRMRYVTMWSVIGNYNTNKQWEKVEIILYNKKIN